MYSPVEVLHEIDGTGVGTAVVGLGVGAGVGTSVGLGVGAGVGATVGAGIGLGRRGVQSSARREPREYAAFDGERRTAFNDDSTWRLMRADESMTVQGRGNSTALMDKRRAYCERGERSSWGALSRLGGRHIGGSDRLGGQFVVVRERVTEGTFRLELAVERGVHRRRDRFRRLVVHVSDLSLGARARVGTPPHTAARPSG